MYSVVMNNKLQKVTISLGLVLAAGLLLNTTAFTSAQAQHQHEYGNQGLEEGDYLYGDYNNFNHCQKGLEVYAQLHPGEYGYSFDQNTQLRISFSYGEYVKSKVVPITQGSVGYLFYNGVVPEYGEFKVTLRNLDTNAYEVVTGINSPTCNPEYVSIEVPQ